MVLVQALVSPKSNQLICLTSSFALILENSVGFSAFGVAVASSTSAPIPDAAPATSARNAAFLLISFPLRGSFFPVLAIAFVSGFGSVLSSDLTSTLLSTASLDLFLNLELAVVTNVW